MNEKQLTEIYQRAVSNSSEGGTIHMRVMNRSRDASLAQLDLQPYASDEAIRLAVARFMEVSVERLGATFVERHENGNITVRPEAVFG